MFWKTVWKRFYAHRLGRWAFFVVILFCLVGIYAPFLASSKPIFVVYDGECDFPLFRYLFYRGFYTKPLDIFFNLLMFTFPAFVLCGLFLKESRRRVGFLFCSLVQIALFLYFIFFPLRDPAANIYSPGNWTEEVHKMGPYQRLNVVLRYTLRKKEHEALLPYAEKYASTMKQAGLNPSLPTLWEVAREHEESEIQNLQSQHSESAQAKLKYILDRRQWLEEQSHNLRFLIMPLISWFHWEDDAGGQQALNHYIPTWYLTRINRKDLTSALIFGVRTSLTVGILSVGLALLIGIPIGAFAGFYGGKFDIVVSRLLEIWEAMPVLFMLLMVVAILQNKSIFLVTLVIGVFGWTSFSRYVRGEFFKQRSLSYVEACHALGFKNRYIMFKHIMPNAVAPILTLLPFAIMGAITSEAGLSFLGLGEEGSSSWGVLMDEGRTAFPDESYLLWPPAILLTILLVAIALVGDSLRDTLDPKLQR